MYSSILIAFVQLIFCLCSLIIMYTFASGILAIAVKIPILPRQRAEIYNLQRFDGHHLQFSTSNRFRQHILNMLMGFVIVGFQKVG